jgi:hypothetical protein
MTRFVNTWARIASIGALLTSAACWFAEETPEDATLFCGEDAACPSTLRCNLSSHICTKPDLASDADPPSLDEASVDPAFAKDGDTVRVTVRANEPITAASLVFGPDVLDPGFDVELNGDGAVFSLVVAAESPAGVVAIDGVRLRDEAGNERVSPVDALAFRIDRTPPAILRASAVGTGPDGIASDIPPNDFLTVFVEVDEPLSSVTARFQAILGEPLACLPNTEASLAYVCTLGVRPELPNGMNDIVVEARDRAGNTTSIETALHIDTAAPSVLPQTARALLFDADGDLAPVLVPGGTLQVDFDIDELPALTPVVEIVLAGESTPLVVVQTGLHVRATLAIAQIATAGTATVQVTLKDAVGHEASTTLALAAPLESGIAVVATAPSACENPAPGACPDADGDGALGLDDDCEPPLGADLDCDDDDATAFPGALDLPGDERDNDCLGDGDSPIDEAGWVFARCQDHDDPICSGTSDFDDGHAGTRDDPHQSLRFALERAKASGRGVIADGMFHFEYGLGLILVEVPLVGGVSASLDWQRVPVVDNVPLSYVTEIGGVEIGASMPIADIAGYDVGWSLAPGVSLVRVAGGDAAVDSRGRIVGGAVDVINVRTGATDVWIVDSVSQKVFAHVLSRAVVTHTRVTGELEASTGAELTLVGSEGTIVANHGTVRAFFSRISSGTAPRAVRIEGGTVLLVDSVLVAGAGKALFELCPEFDCGVLSWSLHSTRIELDPDAVAISEFGEPTPTIAADLVDCTAPACTSATAVEVVVPPATGTLTGTDAFALGAPPTAVTDANGGCVPGVDGSWPLGPR